MSENTNQTIAELIDLLRIERDTIRNGEFDELAQLAARKEEVMTALVGTPARKLMQAQEMAHENQRLLEAALKGVRAAQARLKAITQATKSYQSYDQRGRAKTIAPEGGSVERRA